MNRALARWRFFGIFFLVLLSAAFQIFVHGAYGVSPNFALAIVLAVCGLLSLPETIALSLMGVWALNWAPSIGIETILFALLPVVSSFASRIFPLQSWVQSVASLTFGLALFSLFVRFSSIINSPFMFILMWAMGILFGSCVYFIVSRVFPAYERGVVIRVPWR